MINTHKVTLEIPEELLEKLADLIVATGSVRIMDKSNREHETLSERENKVWQILNSYADEAGLVSNVGLVQIGHESGKVGNAGALINSLSSKGWLTVINRRKGVRNQYLLHGPVQKKSRKRHLRAVKPAQSA